MTRAADVELPAHLGGHQNVTHIDVEGLRYLAGELGVVSVLDVGAGVCGMAPICDSLGLVWTGIEGVPLENAPLGLQTHDFATGRAHLAGQWDLGWSVEFLEHVFEEHLPGVFDAFSHCRYVACTANPGRGPWHFNPQPLGYWLERFAAEGWSLMPDVTVGWRKRTSMRREFVRDTGLVFKKNPAIRPG